MGKAERTSSRIASLALALAWPGAAWPGSELPGGFGDIPIGAPWDEVDGRYESTTLDHLTTPWDHFVQECGYRTVVLTAGSGELVLTVQNFVVTEMSYVTPIEPGSDVREVADLVMSTYGQPQSAELHDGFGQATIGTDVNAVVLDYEATHAVRFTVVGADVWQYTTTITHEDRRWHENRTLRCAREMEKAAKRAG